jgi:hypothetical protein
MAAVVDRSQSSVPLVRGPLKHPADATAEPDLQKQQRGFMAANPGARFVADVLSALHAGPQPLRQPRALYAAFGPLQVLQAFGARAELRVRLVRAITGGPPGLLRRLTAEDLAKQIELLVTEDLPPAERALRAEEDRTLDVFQLYLKYLDPSDLAAYLPAEALWQYESQDQWWTRDPGPTTRALMTAELKSIRSHGILADGEILDLLGDETLERDLPLAARTRLRAAARLAGREGRAFRDSDLFTALRSEDGKRDLTDHLVDHVALPTLRLVVARAAEVLGLTVPAEVPAARTPAKEAAKEPAKEAAREPARLAARQGKEPAAEPAAPVKEGAKPAGAAQAARGVKRRLTPAAGNGAADGATPPLGVAVNPPVSPSADDQPPEPGVEFIDPESWLSSIEDAT